MRGLQCVYVFMIKLDNKRKRNKVCLSLCEGVCVCVWASAVFWWRGTVPATAWGRYVHACVTVCAMNENKEWGRGEEEEEEEGEWDCDSPPIQPSPPLPPLLLLLSDRWGAASGLLRRASIISVYSSPQCFHLLCRAKAALVARQRARPSAAYLGHSEFHLRNQGCFIGFTGGAPLSASSRRTNCALSNHSNGPWSLLAGGHTRARMDRCEEEQSAQLVVFFFFSPSPHFHKQIRARTHWQSAHRMRIHKTRGSASVQGQLISSLISLPVLLTQKDAPRFWPWRQTGSVFSVARLTLRPQGKRTHTYAPHT